jgi:hypothetical protein
MVEDEVDAIDLNFGCPQVPQNPFKFAKRIKTSVGNRETRELRFLPALLPGPDSLPDLTPAPKPKSTHHRQNPHPARRRTDHRTCQEDRNGRSIFDHRTRQDQRAEVADDWQV